MSRTNRWPTMKLGDICDIIYGKALKKSDRVAGPVPVYGSNGVVDYHSKALFEGPTIIVGRKGSAGAVEWSDSSCWIIDTAFSVQRLSDNVSLRWLFWALKYLDLGKLQKHATIPGISKSDVLRETILLPPLATQQRIADILDQVENLKKLNEEQYLLLSSSLGRSLIFELASLNAPSVKLADISTISSGSTPSRKKSGYYGGSIPWVKTNEVNGREIFDTEEKLTELGLKESSCKIYPAGTVLIAMYGQGATRGQAGLLGVRAATNQACASVVPHDLEDSEFIFEALKANYEQLRSLGRGGTQPNLNLSLVKDFQIPYPSKEQRQEFRERIAAVHKIKLMNAERLAKLTEVSQALKTRAFAGQL